MNMSKRILILALIIVLVIAFVPLGGRIAALPCQYMWRYAITYGLPGGTVPVPEDSFPHFPPLCMDVLSDHTGML